MRQYFLTIRSRHESHGAPDNHLDHHQPVPWGADHKQARVQVADHPATLFADYLSIPGQFLLIALTMAIGISISAAADANQDMVPIGKADKIINDTQEQFGDQKLKKLEKRQSIFLGHNLITGPKSGTRIRFRDGSFFKMGPDGRAIIDDFVYSPTESVSGKAIEVVKGTFSFVSGVKAPGHTLSVKTPLSTIGIRGSLLRGFHWPGFATSFYLPAGEADVKTSSGESALMKAGDTLVIPHDSQEPAQDIPPQIKAEIARYVEGRLKPVRLNGKVPKRSAKQLTEEGAQNLALQRAQSVKVASTQGTALIKANAKSEPAAINHARKRMPFFATAIDSGYFNSNASAADRSAVDSVLNPAMGEQATALMGKLTKHLQKTSQRVETTAAKQVAAGFALASKSPRDIALTTSSIAAGDSDLAVNAVKGAMAIKGKTDRPEVAARIAVKAVEGAPGKALQILQAAINGLPEEDKLDGARQIAKAIADENPSIMAEINTLTNRMQPEANLDVPEHERERAGLNVDEAALGIVNEKIAELEEGQNFDNAKDSFRGDKGGNNTPSLQNQSDDENMSMPDADSLLESINWPIVILMLFIIAFVVGVVIAALKMSKDQKKR